ncbi:hypothetical protein ACTFIV_009537 [Dictyostelium citrinum]
MKVISNLLFFILISCSLLLAKGQVNCVTDSSDASCTNFQYPLANITADINSLCVSMPYMPVCTIQQSCNEASSTSGICAPFSILGDSCLHDMPGMSGCSNFKKLCASGSVVEQCSTVDSVTNLPTTMQMWANIQSICNEMTMTGCEKCTKLNATCDVLTVYSTLCLAMPEMSQCANWTSMCASTGDIASSPISSGICTDEPTPATDCFTNPSDPSCADYVYTAANANADISNLCKSMPYMTVCSIQQSCNEASSTSGICAPFSILGDSCLHDMPGMNGCSNFKKLCASGSVVEQCSSVDSISNLPTTMQLFAGIKSICTEMAMDGCEKCSGNSPTTTCDVLPVYSSLCMAMPDMSQCANWTKMCSSSGQLYDSEITSDYCVASVTDAVPIMRMYFHTGILDYILFKSWVPRTDRQFAGSWFAIFFFAIFFELEKTLRSILEKRWTPKKKDSDDDSSLISSSLLGGSYPKFSYRDIIRGCLHAIELTCSYALMLVAMTFNVALFFAVIAGVLVGNILFGRYRNYTPRVTCCE